MTPEERSQRIVEMPNGPTKTLFQAFENGAKNPRSFLFYWEGLVHDNIPLESDAERQARALQVNALIQTASNLMNQALKLAQNRGGYKSSGFDLLSRKDNYDLHHMYYMDLKYIMERVILRANLDLIDQGFEGTVESLPK